MALHDSVYDLWS